MSLVCGLFSHPEDTAIGLAFLEKYKPLLMNVARSRGLDETNAEDVAQEALRKMLVGFKQFQRERKGSFRAWLRTIAHSSTVDWFRGQARLEKTIALECAREVPAKIAVEYQTDLMEAAIRKVRLELHPRTWEMFERVRLNREPARVVAESMGLRLVTIYNGAQRVNDRLRELYNQFDQMHQE